MAVGGALESLHVVPGTLDIIVKRRQGFVTLAAETGAAIVPVISFGENELFDAEIVPPESPFGKFQKCVAACNHHEHGNAMSTHEGLAQALGCFCLQKCAASQESRSHET